MPADDLASAADTVRPALDNEPVDKDVPQVAPTADAVSLLAELRALARPATAALVQAQHAAGRDEPLLSDASRMPVATSVDDSLAPRTEPASAVSSTLAGLGALPATPAAVAGGANVAEARLSASPGSGEFAAQFGSQLTTFVRQGVQHARLQLHPAELGPVTVRIQLDGQAAQVHLAAEHAFTRQALEQALPMLASHLREAGLTLSGGGVFEQPRQRSGDEPPPPPTGHGGDSSQPGAEPALRGVTTAPMRRGVVDLVA